MNDYVDGYAFPLAQDRLVAYKELATEVARIWKKYGAISYQEWVGEGLNLSGTRPFAEAVDVQANEVVVFGWLVFPSRQVRDRAHEQVAADPEMAVLMAASNTGFDATRMAYDGFKPLVIS